MNTRALEFASDAHKNSKQHVSLKTNHMNNAYNANMIIKSPPPTPPAAPCLDSFKLRSKEDLAKYFLENGNANKNRDSGDGKRIYICFGRAQKSSSEYVRRKWNQFYSELSIDAVWDFEFVDINVRSEGRLLLRATMVALSSRIRSILATRNTD